MGNFLCDTFGTFILDHFFGTLFGQILRHLFGTHFWVLFWDTFLGHFFYTFCDLSVSYLTSKIWHMTVFSALYLTVPGCGVGERSCTWHCLGLPSRSISQSFVRSFIRSVGRFCHVWSCFVRFCQVFNNFAANLSQCSEAVKTPSLNLPVS